MLEYYPSLVEAAIEFKVHSRKLLAEKDGKYLFNLISITGKSFSALPEHETCDYLEEEFKLIKDEETGYVYCCRHDQSSK